LQIEFPNGNFTVSDWQPDADRHNIEKAAETAPFVTFLRMVFYGMKLV
jgi:hypothetical protein